MPKQITLGNVPLFADRPVTWIVRHGTRPSMGEFEVSPQGLEKLLDDRGPMDLKIIKDDGTIQQIFGLWVLQELPSSDPFRRRVRVADRRWLWGSKVITADYNKRRRSGYYHIDANDVTQLQRVEPDFDYAKFSVDKNGKAWTAQAILTMLLDRLSFHEQLNGGAAFTVYRTKAFDKIGPMIIENIELYDDMAAAVQRVLAYLPEATLFVDHNGNVNLSTTNDFTAEQIELGRIGEEIIGGGHALFSLSHANEAPTEVHVLFLPECEVRFDFDEDADNAITSALPSNDETTRTMHNVVQITEYDLLFSTGLECQGTYARLPQYLVAVGPTPAPMNIAQLTMDLVRQAALPWMDLWADLLKIGYLDTDHDWAARVGSIETAFRRLMQLPRGWVDRTLSIKPFRIATVNQSTGARAPATVYSDFFVLGTQRGHQRDWGPSEILNFGINVTGYSATLGESTKPAPFLVQLADPEIGILRFDPKADVVNVYGPPLLGKLASAGMPANTKASSVFAGSALTFDSVQSAGAKRPSLDTNYKSSVILTLVPAAPNDERRMFRIVVKPDDIAGLTPSNVLESAKRARGPVKEVLVGPGVETARIRWRDDRATDIERLFGIQDGTPDLSGLVLNATGRSADAAAPVAPEDAEALGKVFGMKPFQPGAVRGASLDTIARAIAARVWASYADHAGGSATGDLNVEVKPHGRISAVEHTIAPNGVATTRIGIPAERPPELSFLSLLDSSTRRIILRQINTPP